MKWLLSVFSLIISFQCAHAQIITTIAGNGAIGISADGELATAASLDMLGALTIDGAHNIFFAESGRVRKIDAATGILTTIAGNGIGDYSGDGGPATDASLGEISALAFNDNGDLFIAHGDYQGEYPHTYLRKVSLSGTISTIGGGISDYSGNGGPASAAQFNYIAAIACDAAGSIFIADKFNNVIRKINSAGIITTVIGDAAGGHGYSGDGGPASDAKLFKPNAIQFNSTGELYISDLGNLAVRKTDASGNIATVAAMAGDYIAVDSKENIYLSFALADVVRRINPAGVVTTYAGTGSEDYNGDGIAATSAGLHGPSILAIDDTGNLYITDVYHYRIRKVSANPLALPAIASGHTLQAYPNPATGMVTFKQHSAVHTPAIITITDILGRPVETMTTGNNGSILWNTSSVQAGMYFYSAITGTASATGMLIIEH